MHSQIRLLLFSVGVLGVCLVPAHFIVSTTHANAQPPAATQTSFPVGRVGQINSRDLVKISIVNTTSIDLYTAISGGARIELPQQAKTTFDFDSTPINVFAYPASGEASLKFNTTSEHGNPKQSIVLVKS